MSDAPRPRIDSLPNLVASCGLAVALVLLVQVLRVDASRPLGMLAADAQVAVVNVARVFEQIDERANWDMRIEALRASVQEEAAGRQAAMERRLAESEQATDTESRQRIRDEVALMQLRFEQWASVKSAEVDREESLKWRSIYRNLRRETARVAEAEGFELVMVNDSIGEISTTPGTQVPLQQQVIEQITNRRILFADRTVDITDQVIVRMNNAINAAP